MKLTAEQLEAIKLKIETEKILPMQAIKVMYLDVIARRISRQLFNKYDKEELRSHAKSAKDTE